MGDVGTTYVSACAVGWDCRVYPARVERGRGVGSSSSDQRHYPRKGGEESAGPTFLDPPRGETAMMRKRARITVPAVHLYCTCIYIDCTRRRCRLFSPLFFGSESWRWRVGRAGHPLGVVDDRDVHGYRIR